VALEDVLLVFFGVFELFWGYVVSFAGEIECLIGLVVEWAVLHVLGVDYFAKVFWGLPLSVFVFVGYV
jgi:hypothetical protein